MRKSQSQDENSSPPATKPLHTSEPVTTPTTDRLVAGVNTIDEAVLHSSRHLLTQLVPSQPTPKEKVQQ